MIKSPATEVCRESVTAGLVRADFKATPIVVEETQPRPQCLQISGPTLYALGSRKYNDMNNVSTSRKVATRLCCHEVVIIIA